MKPIEFEGQNAVYAKDQPEYIPLPVCKLDGKEGEVISCWELTEEEKAEVARTGRLWLSVWTFRQALQPLLLTVERPENIPK